MNQPGSEVIEKISSNCMKITRHEKKPCGRQNSQSLWSNKLLFSHFFGWAFFDVEKAFLLQ